jgi:Arc/MetJ-type ribon-helix-helix transcriptional regulator
MTALAADLEQFVQQEISSGRFPNRDSVLTYALRLLRQEREEAVNGIRLGLADVAAGRVQSLSDAFADLRGELDVSHDT